MKPTKAAKRKMKRKRNGRVPVQSILNGVRKKLEHELKQKIAQYQPYLVGAEMHGWPYGVQVVVEMPEEVVEELKQKALREKEQQLRAQLSPDARLQLAAREAQDEPLIKTAGKGFRSSDRQADEPDKVTVAPGQYEMCELCIGEGKLGIGTEEERACGECEGKGLIALQAEADQAAQEEVQA